jgi:hypothetical protein
MNQPIGQHNTAVYTLSVPPAETEAAAQILWQIMPLSIAREITENAIDSPRAVTICEPLISMLIELGCTVNLWEGVA